MKLAEALQERADLNRKIEEAEDRYKNGGQSYDESFE